LHSLAERAGDEKTAAVVERILEQEEAAAELVAGTFDRALDHTLGEPPTSRLPGVTPIGKPSERLDDAPTPHHGPQEVKGNPVDMPTTAAEHPERVGSTVLCYPDDAAGSRIASGGGG
jgi:hypothetical protein